MLVGWVGCADNAWAQANVAAPSGIDTFNSYCATCHGTGGKGDGPLASSLRTRPPDLTLLAARNGGKFDPDQVAQIIDGRNPVKGHGGGEMPVWGEIFAKSIDQDARDGEDQAGGRSPAIDAAAVNRARVHVK
jgi:mono/diheme cytochrome c family protein